uniref:Uncharacterized protein n=1 Tax=Pseudomonas phage vB_PaPhi_Mx1 TaxID=3079664 RepID=A0AAU0N675_9CAUD
MATRTVYVRPEDPAPPVLSAGRLIPGELYRAVAPSSAEGVIVLATTGPWHVRSVVLHSMNPSVYPVGLAVVDDAWRFRRLGAGEYVKLVQGG